MNNVSNALDEDTGATQDTTKEDTWATAALETRNAAKWLIATLGALGLGIFGAAPALRGLEFSWSDTQDQAQLFFAILFSLLGLGSILLLIFVVAQVLVPVRVGPADLTAETKNMIANDAAYWLPEGVKDIEALRTKLADTRKNLISDQMTLDRLETAKKALHEDQHDESLDESIAQVSAAIERYKKNIDSYNAYINRILRTDALEITQDRFYHPWNRKNLTVKLALLAAVGSVGFLFSLAKPDEPEPAPAAAELGYIVRGSNQEASTDLWNALNLDNCAIDGQVPVLVTSTENTVTSVRTIQATEECPTLTFDVVPEAARVVIPEPTRIDITYTE